MIIYKTAQTNEELEQILALQRANLPSNISYEEKKTEGFVTVLHDLNILTKMNNERAHFIASDGDRVVGYALCMHPKFGDEIEILKPMFAQINASYLKDQSFIVMGQVCVAKGYRNQGIFRKLYETMKTGIAPDFSVIVTEVDVINKPSLKAHYAIGFELVKKYHSDGHDWELIALS